MSKLDELIKKYCPNGTEYKRIEELCDILDSKRKPVSKEKRIKGKYPYYGANGIQDYINDYLFDGTFLLIGEDGSVINKDKSPVLNWVTGKIWVNNHAHILKSKDICLLRYIYYVLQTIDISMMVRGTPPKLNQFSLKCMRIPVPPLPVQEEIVRILDSFTKLTEELTEELINRKKQYEYYRDELLNFDKINKYCPNGIKYKKLEEFATINRGGSLQKKDFVDKGIPCIHYGQIYTKYGLFADKTFTYISEKIASKQKFAEKNDIVMAVTSENLKDVCSCLAWLGNEKIAISGHTAIIHHNQNAKFMSYYFHSIHFQKQKNKLAHGTKVIEVTPSKLKNIIIPIPSIVEQECIVDILDKFEVMYNNLYSEISAEIELRKKQYEYYRDKLLTFKELKQ